MICPFRGGVRFEYSYIGADTVEDRQKSDNYIETAQHAVFEKCYEGDCPFYNYTGLCSRVEGE